MVARDCAAAKRCKADRAVLALKAGAVATALCIKRRRRARGCGVAQA